MGVAPEIAARRRILIVDDIELNRVLTEAVLRGAAYDVHSVGDGNAALDALDARTYDLILMDLDMPGLSGHDAATEIRRRDRPRHVKLVALSSHGDAMSRLRSCQVGMSAHIARPIAVHAFLKAIEGVFSQISVTERPDPWQRELYDEWVERLGAERMRGFLAKLLDQFRDLLTLLAEPGSLAHDDLHRMAHDVSSTGGMLGFADVTRCCRGILEAAESDVEAVARAALADALTAAILRLDNYLSPQGPISVAA